MRMEQVINVLLQDYAIVTLACVIIGYLVTTTPYLQRAKDFVPVIVTIIGACLAVAIHGYTVDVVILGGLAGLLSTGLYELFGKGIKNLGKTLERRYAVEETNDRGEE